jgi:predicted aspartyl protease
MTTPTKPSQLFILLLSLFSIATAFSQARNEVIKIPFELTGSGHILIKAAVNGVEGNFIFDTGAGLNMMTKKFADKIRNLKHTDNFYTGHRATGEALQLDLWNAASLKMGSLAIANPEFTVLDIDLPLDGLISLLPFKDSPVTIDYKNKILTVESAASLRDRVKSGTSIPIQVSYDRGKTLGISTNVTINNKLTIQVSLDSGAGNNVFRFNSRYMKNLGIDTASIAPTYVKSDFKPGEGNNYYPATVAEMAAGKSKVANIKATFIEGLIYEGITGTNWLGDIITIDVPNSRMIINR